MKLNFKNTSTSTSKQIRIVPRTNSTITAPTTQTNPAAIIDHDELLICLAPKQDTGGGTDPGTGGAAGAIVVRGPANLSMQNPVTAMTAKDYADGIVRNYLLVDELREYGITGWAAINYNTYEFQLAIENISNQTRTLGLQLLPLDNDQFASINLDPGVTKDADGFYTATIPGGVQKFNPTLPTTIDSSNILPLFRLDATGFDDGDYVQLMIYPVVDNTVSWEQQLSTTLTNGTATFENLDLTSMRTYFTSGLVFQINVTSMSTQDQYSHLAIRKFNV